MKTTAIPFTKGKEKFMSVVLHVRDLQIRVLFCFDIDVALFPLWLVFLLAQRLEICFFVWGAPQQLQLQADVEFLF